jgi:hypothetical protein
MKCAVKETYRKPSPGEIVEKEAIKKQSELSKLAPLYSGSYIIVYGRDSCGWTQKYRKDFENMNIHYVYKSVDNKNVGDELYPRMKKAGLDVSSINLPVIDVNAHILIRPEMKKILDIYKTE